MIASSGEEDILILQKVFMGLGVWDSGFGCMAWWIQAAMLVVIEVSKRHA